MSSEPKWNPKENQSSNAKYNFVWHSSKIEKNNEPRSKCKI
jgi:hypothetical protein